MSEPAYYLEYITAGDERVFLKFANENNRDGCHISLDMYKVQLGPVDMTVLTRIAQKFQGEVVRPDGENVL